MARPCKSPCTGHCALNRQQICVGCGRTRSEITGWRTMSEEEQKETIKRNGRLINRSLRDSLIALTTQPDVSRAQADDDECLSFSLFETKLETKTARKPVP